MADSTIYPDLNNTNSFGNTTNSFGNTTSAYNDGLTHNSGLPHTTGLGHNSGLSYNTGLGHNSGLAHSSGLSHNNGLAHGYDDNGIARRRVDNSLTNDRSSENTAAGAASNAANSLLQNASAAYRSVADGPLAQNVLDQHNKTTDQLSNLAAARRRPEYGAATGQQLTHYHSFFFELLSWNNPRASAIAYTSVVAFIFSVRYLDIMRYAFKLTWMALGVTVAAEIAGKLALNNGFATQIRPRRYYTVPKETLNAAIGDVHELVNFFVIEAQRILFAENVTASAATAVAAFTSYYLAKIMPYWGLAILFTTLAFFVPLVYTSNQELIDNAIHQATDVVSAQTIQIRDVATKHTAQAADITKQYVGDYTAKAQALVKGHTSPTTTTATTTKHTEFPATSTTLGRNEHIARADHTELPTVPTTVPVRTVPHHEPVLEPTTY